MTDAGVARTGLELGGVQPPTYSSDPTLVVWREYGKFRDRVPLMVSGYVLYAAVAVSVELIGPHRLLGTFPYLFDTACSRRPRSRAWS